MTPALAARYGHAGRHKLGLSMASVTVAWRGANAVGAAGLSEPEGRLKVATGASPWSGMQQTTEPRQGRLNALIPPNIPRIMLNAVRIGECPKFLLETALSMVFLLTFDVSTYPRRHGLTHAERGGSSRRAAFSPFRSLQSPLMGLLSLGSRFPRACARGYFQTPFGLRPRASHSAPNRASATSRLRRRSALRPSSRVHQIRDMAQRPLASRPTGTERRRL